MQKLEERVESLESLLGQFIVHMDIINFNEVKK
jgi:hypothetical protein